MEQLRHYAVVVIQQLRDVTSLLKPPKGGGQARLAGRSNQGCGVGVGIGAGRSWQFWLESELDSVKLNRLRLRLACDGDSKGYVSKLPIFMSASTNDCHINCSDNFYILPLSPSAMMPSTILFNDNVSWILERQLKEMTTT